jgi:hypothetical protein
MNNSKWNLGVFALIAAVFVGVFSCEKESSFLSGTEELQSLQNRGILTETPKKTPRKGPYVSGKGALLLGGLNGSTQEFSFFAQTDPFGTVTGDFESKGAGQDGLIRGAIDCMNVLSDGKTVILTIVITEVVGETFIDGTKVEVGHKIWIKVQDNASAGNSEGDKMTEFFNFHTCAISCAEDMDTKLSLIQNGTIELNR